MANHPTPTGTRKLKDAIGLFRYYHRFITKLAKIAYRLYKLLLKDVQFIRREVEKTVFETLRKLIWEEPVLKATDLSQPFIVPTDASDFALGAILSLWKIGSDNPCAYTSRCLRSELRYPTYDKGLFAILFAKEVFRCYLYRRRFVICTEIEALKHFYSTKKPGPRFNRLNAALMGYDFYIVYISCIYRVLMRCLGTQC